MLSKKIILSIEKEPNFIKTIKLDVLKKAIIEADDKYYNDEEPTMSDDVYDYIRNYIIDHDPTFETNQHAAVEVKDENKVKLPIWMGSMTKNKDFKGTVENVIISDKLDGVSCLVDKKSSGDIKLYTRGNGKFGRDITYLLQYINGIDTSCNRMVRGELIMKTQVFEQIKDGESNARNTVAGFVNSKIPNAKYKNKVDFVAYELIENDKPLTPEKQFAYLSKTKFNVVHNEKVKMVDKNILSVKLKIRKLNSPYEIDGIIVSKNETYDLIQSGNPKHAFAYKENDISFHVKTTVEKVEWNISKDKFLKPIVHFQEVKIKNVKITKATGYNAKYIFENKIGKGTEITIERSGDVIPKIVSIDKHTQADMPTTKYLWNNSKVDIYVSDDDESQNNTIKLKVFQNMLDKLDITGMGNETIQKVFDANVRTIFGVYSMTLGDIQKLDNFGEKSSKKLYDSIQHRKTTLTCIEYMVASNVFGSGFGYKVLHSITSKYHPFDNVVPTLDDLKAIDGIGKVTAKNYLEGLQKFKQFVTLNELDSVCKVKKVEEPKKEEVKKESEKFKGKVIMFTGFRNNELEKLIVKNGGEVKMTMSKKVNLIVYTSINKKVEKAIENNIETITLEEFKKSLL
jgi:NAD-dependent DNA ligase